MLVNHRFLLHPMIYSQQRVLAHQFYYQQYHLAVASTRELRYFQFAYGYCRDFSHVCFEVSTGFPVSYAQSAKVAMAKARAMLHCENVSPNTAKELYGLANIPTKLLEISDIGLF